MLKWLTRQRVSAKKIEFKNLEQEAGFSIFYAVLYILIAIGCGLLIVHYSLPLFGSDDFIQDFWYSIVFKITFLLILPGIIFFTIWNYRFSDLLLGKKYGWKEVSVVILMFGIGFSLNLSHISRVVPVFNDFADGYFRLLMAILLPFLIAGLPEELFFRGILQTRLEKKWGRWVAILVANTLFTAWHLPSRYLLSTGVEGEAGDFTGILLGTGVPVFLVGLFFSFHWSKYRDFILLVAMHWAIDILPTVSALFGVGK